MYNDETATQTRYRDYMHSVTLALPAGLGGLLMQVLNRKDVSNTTCALKLEHLYLRWGLRNLSQFVCGSDASLLTNKLKTLTSLYSGQWLLVQC